MLQRTCFVCLRLCAVVVAAVYRGIMIQKNNRKKEIVWNEAGGNFSSFTNIESTRGSFISFSLSFRDSLRRLTTIKLIADYTIVCLLQEIPPLPSAWNGATCSSINCTSLSHGQNISLETYPSPQYSHTISCCCCLTAFLQKTGPL